MNRAYDSKRKLKLEIDKSGAHPIKIRQTDQAPKIKNSICNSLNTKHCVSFLLGLLARSKPRSFSVHYLKHIAL